MICNFFLFISGTWEFCLGLWVRSLKKETGKAEIQCEISVIDKLFNETFGMFYYP